MLTKEEFEKFEKNDLLALYWYYVLTSGFLLKNTKIEDFADETRRSVSYIKHYCSVIFRDDYLDSYGELLRTIITVAKKYYNLDYVEKIKELEMEIFKIGSTVNYKRMVVDSGLAILGGEEVSKKYGAPSVEIFAEQFQDLITKNINTREQRSTGEGLFDELLNSIYELLRKLVPLQIEVEINKTVNRLKKNDNPEKTDADPENQNSGLTNERRVSNKIIKDLRKKNRQLTLRQNKPTIEELKKSMDQNRFKESGKVNCTKVGEEYGKNHKTIKSWIQTYGLSEYAFNPD